jgi:transposase-like protein
MGRKSKLTPDQWADVSRRLIAGETPSDLAREYGVHPSQITRRGLAQKTQKVKEVAQKLADAQNALAALPVAEQYTALSLAEKLRSISANLASAADYGAKTAHRLHALANSEVAKVDDADPIGSADKLRNVGVLTKLANESASIAVNILAANKGQGVADTPPDLPTVDLSKLSPEAKRELLAAKDAARL